MASTKNIVVETAILGSMAGLLLGLGAGCVAGNIKSQRIKAVTERATTLMPQAVANIEDFKSSLLTLASGARNFNQKTFLAMTEQLGHMVVVAQKLADAVPTSVQPALANIGMQFIESLRDKLYKFYDASGITVVKVRDTDLRTVAALDLQPVHRDLRLAHQVLIAAMQCVADDMQATAAEKLIASFADRQG